MEIPILYVSIKARVSNFGERQYQVDPKCE